MLHARTHGECARKENLDAAVMKNYHSHDHCLLSKWKRHACVCILTCATWQKPCRKRVYPENSCTGRGQSSAN